MELENILKTHREEQVKYIYYKIGVAVAAIGFSVNQTINDKFSYQHIPLLISMFLFVLSIYFGFKFIEHFLGLLWLNKEHLDPRTADGVKITNPDIKKIHYDVSLGELIKRSNNTKYFSGNNYTLIAGISFFVIWYIINFFI